MIHALLLAAILGVSQTGDLQKGLVFDAPLTSAFAGNGTVVDRATDRHHLTQTNSPTVDSTGTTGDNVNKHLSRTEDDFRINDQQGTISVWFKTTEASNNVYLIASTDNSNNLDYFDIRMTAGTGYVPIWSIWPSAASNHFMLADTTAKNDGAWHNFIVSSNGSRYLMHVDGEAVTFTINVGADDGTWIGDVPNRNDLTTHAWIRNTPLYGGNVTIAFLKIWDRELSTTEKAYVYDQGREVIAAMTGDLGKGLLFDTPLTSGYLDANGYPNNRAANRLMPASETGTVTYSADGATFDNSSYLTYAAGSPGSDDLIVSGDFTVAAWIKTSASDNDNILGYLLSGSDYWTLGINAGAPNFKFNTLTQNALASTYNDNAWHFLLAKRTGTTVTFWVDNVLQDTDTKSGDNVTGGTFEIGRLTNDLYRYTGSVAFHRQYDWYLTDDQATLLYEQGRKVIAAQTGALWSRLIQDIPLNTGYAQPGNLPSDRAPASTHVDTVYSDPVLGADSATFDGVDDCYRDDSDFQTQFVNTASTISVWAKYTGTGTGFIYGAHDLTSKDGTEIYVIGDGSIRLGFFRTGQGYNVWESDATLMSDGDWHHIVYVAKNVGPYFYVDGVAVSFTSIQSSGSSFSRTMAQLPNIDHYTIGCRRYNSTGNSFFFKGEISDVRHYDAELSASDAFDLYAKGRRLP